MKFSKDHEWITVAGGIATIGISTHAQGQLGDVVFVDLPKVGRVVKANESVATVESVKAASDVYVPVSGEVVEVNAECGRSCFSQPRAGSRRMVYESEAVQRK